MKLIQHCKSTTVQLKSETMLLCLKFNDFPVHLKSKSFKMKKRTRGFWTLPFPEPRVYILKKGLPRASEGLYSMRAIQPFVR